MITLDPADLVRIATGLGALGGGFGATFAFLKPYAAQWLSLRLERERRASEIEDEARRAKVRSEGARDGALERIAVQHERIVGVLEALDARNTRIDARLDRIEAHLGISPTPSAVPSAPVEHVPPRRALTDPDLARVSSLPAPPQSQPAGSRPPA